MNTSSTNKRFALLDKELEAIILEVEEEEKELNFEENDDFYYEPTEICLLYTSPSPRD